jgi:hypothetical protein
MSTMPTTSSLGLAPTWDGDRRVAGGALAGDPPAPEGKDELTFGDFLSVINPLQHIPVVSTLYRWMTGDTIKPAARVVGGALYGGPLGLVSAAFNAVVEQVKGSDIGAQLVAMVTPDPKADGEAAQTAVAAATPEPPKPAPSQEQSNAAALLQLAADLRSTTPSADEAKTPAAPVAPASIRSANARTIGFYQANAGQRLPSFDGSRSGAPVKYALPLPPQSTVGAHPLPIAPMAEKQAIEPTVAREGVPDAWFTSVMMRGLDRYRTSQQQLNKAPAQVDLSE